MHARLFFARSHPLPSLFRQLQNDNSPDVSFIQALFTTQIRCGEKSVDKKKFLFSIVLSSFVWVRKYFISSYFLLLFVFTFCVWVVEKIKPSKLDERTKKTGVRKRVLGPEWKEPKKRRKIIAMSLRRCFSCGPAFGQVGWFKIKSNFTIVFFLVIYNLSLEYSECV